MLLSKVDNFSRELKYQSGYDFRRILRATLSQNVQAVRFFSYSFIKHNDTVSKRINNDMDTGIRFQQICEDVDLTYQFLGFTADKAR